MGALENIEKNAKEISRLGKISAKDLYEAFRPLSRPCDNNGPRSGRAKI